MRLAVWLAVFAAFGGAVSAQRSLLNGFDPGAPSAVIATVPIMSPWAQDSELVGDFFYFEDRATMQEIRDFLIPKSEAVVYPFLCFDEYRIVACVDGRVETMLLVSDNCHQIRRHDPSYENAWNGFDSAYAFNGYFPFNGYKIGKQRRVIYPDRTSAEAAIAEILANPKVLFFNTPEWVNWDGECNFFREHVTFDKAAVTADTKARIEAQFPGIPFDLKVEISSANWRDDYSYSITLRCPAEMGTAMNFWNAKWKPYKFKLTSYWRE